MVEALFSLGSHAAVLCLGTIQARTHTLGLMLNHDLSTRWTHHSFDSVSFFATSNNLGDVLEKLRDITTELASTSQHHNRSQHFVPHQVLHGSRACITSLVIIPVLSHARPSAAFC